MTKTMKQETRPVWEWDSLNPTEDEKSELRAARRARATERRDARLSALAMATAPAPDYETIEWEDLAEPSADDLAFIPAIEADYLAAEKYAAWNRQKLESSMRNRAAVAARLREVRSTANMVVGADAAYATVKTLNVIHRRKNAIAIIGNGTARIDSIEKNDVHFHSVDLGVENQIAYPLLRVDNVDTVTVFPVRLTKSPKYQLSPKQLPVNHSAILSTKDSVTGDVIETRPSSPKQLGAMDQIDMAIANVFTVAAIAETFPNCHSVQLRLTRAIESADKIARSHGSKCIEWDGTNADMLRILLQYAGGRTRILEDHSRDELRMRRVHKTNQAVNRQADSDRAADLLVLLGSLHATNDGIYSALIPNGDTTYALAILDGKAMAEYLERSLTPTERKIIQRKREAIIANTETPKRGESAAMSKLTEDIRRRASRAR